MLGEPGHHPPRLPDGALRWHPKLQALTRYWISVHPERGLPGRQHIDPVDIPEVLASLLLIDVGREPLRFRYRVIGTSNVRMMERDFTGWYLDEAHPDFAVSPIHAQYVNAVEQRRPEYRKGSQAFHLPNKHVTIERVILPLARDGAMVDMLLGVVVYEMIDG
jgi:hypothetical protein